MLNDDGVLEALRALNEVQSNETQEEQQLQAAAAQRDARIAEIARLKELLREAEEDAAARGRAIAEHEQRNADIRDRRPPAEAEVQAAIARARQAIDDELRAAQQARLDALRADAVAVAAAVAEAERELGGAGPVPDSPSISWAHLTLGPQIGRGSFKTVHRGDMRGTPIAALLVPGGSGLAAEVALMARLGN